MDFVRGLEELVDREDSAYPHLRAQIANAACAVEILERNERDAEAALLALQVTTRSFLGAVAYETGGILLDHGWLRVLGAGSPRLTRSIHAWNGLDGERRLGDGLLIADDAVGGFFAWLASSRTVAYFAPDTLSWEDLGLGYEAWLGAMLGQLDRFYADLRWPGWEEEVAQLPPDSALHFAPPLFTKESRPLAACSRRAVPIDDLLALGLGLARQLEAGGVRDGDAIRLAVKERPDR